MTRESQQARTIYNDAHALATHIDGALVALDEAMSGWPTSTPGASAPEGGTITDGVCDEHLGTGTVISGPGQAKVRLICGQPLPCADHPTTATSIVERTAFTDKARRTHEQLQKELRTIQGAIRRAATITLAWRTPGIDKTTIAGRIAGDKHVRRAAIDTGQWCQSCSRFGRSNPPDPGRTECGFCADIRRDYSVDIRTDQAVQALRELHDIKDRRRIYERDITRVLDRHGVTWKRPKKKAS